MEGDININDLVNIAESINHNTIENKKRNKEEKINTDTFIMTKFKISRKKFSRLIKGTFISYNPRTHMYDIPKKVDNNSSIVNQNKLSSSINNYKKNFNKGNQSNHDNLSEFTTQRVKKIIENEYPEILKIISLYKKNEINFIEKSNKKIDIHRPELQGELFSKSFKTYKKVLDDFVEFCSNRIEKQRDLVAIALLEFMEKYS
ncbi:hypothetical protein GTH52_15020 (plasmid) [Clostridium tyrobutyricum]|mgnify:CR=1 FL=1|jgi:hypothetical protein|uniref:Uncharacterized protein n=1 Tax=Clostridium tyrobutyricum DIVETGP TaxID=1408889 RepID=W6NGR3_CLOTY|nr:hypothetical protein [Clostridium tyrobutyricum]AND86322.1 hypothetical protein CTK_P00240 [Clostridium tyrobutyricum]ANP70936.1 hypothetical protein BA182_14660 [Clostridium tyrobutyricum]MBV4432454.1 hypothetical protein [Clostridium tyrobutyricum]MBV4435694.1 hypothetical protein [Clostridium tyrobutyricum]QCH29052.1 hypothetical protein EZN00_02677 [Clostridium tyrobutyricum]